MLVGVWHQWCRKRIFTLGAQLMQLLEKFDSVFKPTVNCSQSDSLVDDPLFHFEINHETKSKQSSLEFVFVIYLICEIIMLLDLFNLLDYNG